MPDELKNGDWQLYGSHGFQDDVSIKLTAIESPEDAAPLPPQQATDECSFCGKTMLKDSLFCRMCGQRRPVLAAGSLKGGAETCTDCATTFMADSRFCRNCGKKRPKGPGSSPRGNAGGDDVPATNAAGSGRQAASAAWDEEDLSPEMIAYRTDKLSELFTAFDPKRSGQVDMRRLFELRIAKEKSKNPQALARLEQQSAKLRTALERTGKTTLDQASFVEFFSARLPKDTKAFEEIILQFTLVAKHSGEEHAKQERKVGLGGVFDAYDLTNAGMIQLRELIGLAQKRALNPVGPSAKWTPLDSSQLLVEMDRANGGVVHRVEFVRFADKKIPDDMATFWEAVSRLTELGTDLRRTAAKAKVVKSIGGGAADATRKVWVLENPHNQNSPWQGPFTAHDVLGMVQAQAVSLDALIGGLDGLANQAPSRQSAKPLVESMAALGAAARRESEMKARQAVSKQIT
eukprot:TRINITY_DN44272_c0_g1_i3.p1 TRINITY_DN44272_c0_g1~~TRINITY_DN44272_c0_g1_i3.p1  ORF type:complete len:520 (+),score=119.02 TRINITY_DN44272_c0_g1_i3:180-1562(+)